MSAYAKCSGCALFTGVGRCSFNRLVAEAIVRNLVLDYLETPTHIQIVCPDTSFYCNPEEAHAVLCAILREHLAEADGKTVPPARRSVPLAAG